MTWLVVVTGALALVSGGAFAAFSTLVPGGLRHLDDAEGAAAMQQINVAAPRSAVFMLIIFGPALLGVVVAADAVLGLDEPGAVAALVGSLLYVLGVAGVTIGFHIPRNDAFGALNRRAAAAEWPQWFTMWVRGNHVRTLCAVLAGLLMLWSQR